MDPAESTGRRSPGRRRLQLPDGRCVRATQAAHCVRTTQAAHCVRTTQAAHCVRTTQAGLRLLALALAVVVVGACGGGDDEESSSTSFPKIPTTAFTGDPNKACALATQSDVEAAVGVPVRPGAGAQGIVCRYEVASRATSFVLIESNESPQASQIYDLKASTAEGVENLTGVGERAFVAGDRAVILRGSRVVTLTMSLGQPPAAVTAALKKLAASVGRHV